MADGPVYTGLAWADYKVLLCAYCEVDTAVNAGADAGVESDYDALLESLFDSAKRRADAYLNNPFEELMPTIVFDSVVAGDYITIGFDDHSAMYSAADALDEDALEFAVGSTDSETADNFCALINSTTLGGSYGLVGIEGVLAANSAGSVVLTRRYGYVGDIDVTTSSDTKLLVRQVRTSIDIPEEVIQWIQQYVKRHFDNRAALLHASTVGRDTRIWGTLKEGQAGMADNFDLISHLRLSPGLG